MVPCPTFPRAGGAFKALSRDFPLDPSSPRAVGKMRAAEKGRATMQSSGNGRVLEAEGGGMEGSLLQRRPASSVHALRVASPWAGKASPPAGRLKSHSHLLPETSSSQAHHLYASLCVGPQPSRRQRSKTERQSPLAVSYKKGLRTVGFQKQIELWFSDFFKP